MLRDVSHVDVQNLSHFHACVLISYFKDVQSLSNRPLVIVDNTKIGICVLCLVWDMSTEINRINKGTSMMSDKASIYEVGGGY